MTPSVAAAEARFVECTASPLRAVQPFVAGAGAGRERPAPTGPPTEEGGAARVRGLEASSAAAGPAGGNAATNGPYLTIFSSIARERVSHCRGQLELVLGSVLGVGIAGQPASCRKWKGPEAPGEAAAPS